MHLNATVEEDSIEREEGDIQREQQVADDGCKIEVGARIVTAEKDSFISSAKKRQVNDEGGKELLMQVLIVLRIEEEEARIRWSNRNEWQPGT
jgi:hypothetical protein